MIKDHKAPSEEKDFYIEHGWFGKLQKIFEKFIFISLKYRYFTIIGIVLIIFSGVLVNVIGNHFEIFPKEDVEKYFARLETKIGTTMEKTRDISQKYSNRIKEKIGPSKVKDLIVTAGHSKQSLIDTSAKFGSHISSLGLSFDLETAKKQKTEGVLKSLRSVDFGE